MLSSIYLLSVQTVPDSSSKVNVLGFFKMIFMMTAQNICHSRLRIYQVTIHEFVNSICEYI